MSEIKSKKFTSSLLDWYEHHGRHDLPWQKNQSPYRVWISEIMLQQTQVVTVIPYYQKFIKKFPNIKSLALADQDLVLTHWSGLGYYARARNLHLSAKIIHEKYRGRFPKSLEILIELPGIGRSTAGAILSFAMNMHATILDGNVKRVLTRYFAIEGWPGTTQISKQLWQVAEQHTPQKRTNEYNQAIMDLGAMICTRSKPQCSICPFKIDCKANQLNKQHQFPTPKPSSNRPKKKIFMLIMHNESNEILLEKRPPTGIWGGLWSFPECGMNENIAQWCAQHYQQEILELQKLNPLTHQFSHFQLEINPILLLVKSTPNSVMESQTRIWYKIASHNQPGGIATPVNRLFKTLSSEVFN